MRNARIKKVIGKGGRVSYYLGNGLWFGRTSKTKAEAGIASGEYILWETVAKAGPNHLKVMEPVNA